MTNNHNATLLTRRNSYISGGFSLGVVIGPNSGSTGDGRNGGIGGAGDGRGGVIGGAGAGFQCDVCGAVYRRRDSLADHRKHHEGRTTCHLCCATFSTVRSLRRHLRELHRLGADEVRRRTPASHL